MIEIMCRKEPQFIDQIKAYIDNNDLLATAEFQDEINLINDRILM